MIKCAAINCTVKSELRLNAIFSERFKISEASDPEAVKRHIYAKL